MKLIVLLLLVGVVYSAAPTWTTTTFAANVVSGTTAVGTIAATDSDGDAVTYAVKAGDTNIALFTLGSTSGVLAFVTAPVYDATTPANNSISVTVTAVAGGETIENAFVVTVVAGAAPTWTGPAASSPVAANVVSGVTAVTTVTATGATGYTLGGTDAALFSVTTAGVITFATAPVFDATTASNNSKTFTVVANQTGHTDSSAVTVNVTVTVGAAPVWATPATGPAAFSVVQQTTAVGTVVATGATGYTLGGTDAALFAIDTNGAITFQAAPTFDNTTPANNSRTFSVVATQQGHTNSAPLTVNVTVLDVAAPVWTTTDFTSNTASGETTVATVVATNSPTYTLATGGDAALFAISATGVITWVAAPVFDQTTASNNVKTFTVQAAAGVSTITASFTATVIIGGAATWTGGNTAAFSVESGSTAVGTVAATAPGAGTLTYTLGGTDAALFAVTSAGVVTFQAAPVFDANTAGNNTKTFTVVATRPSSTNSADLTVTVTVTAAATTTTTAKPVPPPKSSAAGYVLTGLLSLLMFL